MGAGDFELEAGFLRDGRALSIRANGSEVWGWKRPLLGAVRALGYAAGGALSIVQAVTVPFDARRNPGIPVEIRGKRWDGWKRPFGVGLLALALAVTGLVQIIAGLAAVPAMLACGAGGAATHPLLARLGPTPQSAPEPETAAAPAAAPPGPPQPRLQSRAAVLRQRSVAGPPQRQLD